MGKYISSYQPNKWIQVKIPLVDLKASGGSKVEEINSAEILQVLLKQPRNGNGDHQIFIDQVEILNAESFQGKVKVPEIVNAKGYERHVDLSWQEVDPELVRYIKVYRSENNKEYIPVGVQSPMEFSRFVDYTGFPGKTYQYKISSLANDYSESPLSPPVSAHTREMTDEELMEMVQEAAFRYYWDGS